jgi:MSHA biogenesis protein MshI
MYIPNYIKELYHRLSLFFVPEPPQMGSHRCCIRISPKEISLLHVKKNKESIQLFLLKTLGYDGLANLTSALLKIVNKYQLQFIPTYWLLSPEDYQLFLMEALPVKAEEFRDALNWHIRSLISYPLDETVIDYFNLPPKTDQSSPMIAAVAAKKDHLTEIASILQECGLHLTTITIPELALRNLSALYENDEKSTVFIYFYENSAILNITNDKNLYFTRQINLPVSLDSEIKDYEKFSLDILRYLDYYQKQWRRPNPGRIYVATEKKNAVDIAKFLSEYLRISAQPFSFPPVFFGQEKIDTLENKYLLTLGCILSEEEKNAKAGN